ncbi:ISL3 family transposase [Rhodocytophaga aerolata]|uniref:ISL3 family transposase n=4 Tax=Rhodocytophaga aerolata TaxID=455078 RepID=A0ABT8RIN1_9BACT|nr:ISL3 family transposase [Rhodocytophaga aerolata]MDO1451966.1 ISL3 family transposase [Rhodocytophaga aerolata]
MSNILFGTCPLCRHMSHKVHSYYERSVSDLPMSGKVVWLRISVRKFFCQQEACCRKIFAERFDTYLPAYQRRLQRSTAQIGQIGLSCGSKPGAKICRLIGLPVSASTLLRVMKKTPLPEVVTPKVLGIDDFAFRKGNTYGTILGDLTQRKVIDLLPDQESKTVEEWLTAHPGVEVVSRDRSVVYAHAVTAAAPTAVQVADRWHLLKNLSENMARYLDIQRSLITAVAGQLNQKQAATPIQNTNPLISLAANLGLKTIGNHEAIAQLSTEKRYPKYGQVKSLQQQGYGRKTIARHLGLSRNTVRKYFAQSSFVAKVHSRRSNLAEFESYLRKRWGEGETCVKNLWKEIKPMGYNGCYSILADFLSKYPNTPNPHALPPAQKGTTYSSRSLSIALCHKEEDWKDEQKPFLLKLLQKSAILDQARQLSLEFKSLMETKRGHQLESWCQKAEQLPLFKGFVRGIRQDFAAVEQAMTSIWSNGQTEGQVNRLKNIKRQMYGKADFDLLRLRVLIRSG